ncbi:cyclic nucleotide-binding domain protein (macronuclear) [Tetrahymena thermophila SB210]|uniref:Cyclic nucleotide-binding domain protein n=1 Tax=Tetrahymena thermophila (strain SB210) TaxID=312017 RepID=W7XEU1_TETTS|nr:cyclic nucleotide-binding domain protein [Tetrahymena thermophila SB210]EWS76287.1 cyclic nucleotide-binding domain protein [Tetrahymena thermophila SB210]|eukprot:XP_012651071.1 cyclic nucleotide-binding domain protein [Tetrahymena thermophila SB210]
MKQEDEISQCVETIRKIPSLNSKNKDSQTAIFQQDSKINKISSEQNIMNKKNQGENFNQINQQIANEDLHVSNSYIEETLNNFSPRSQTIFSCLQINKMKNQEHVANIKSSNDPQMNIPQQNDLQLLKLGSSPPLKASVAKKIKFFISQFYKKYTISGKTLLLNSRIRKLVSDNSDCFKPSIQTKKLPKSNFHKNLIKYQNCFQNLPLLDSQSSLECLYFIHIQDKE